MLVFFIILIVVILLSLIICFSNMKIEIDTLKIDNKEGLRINDFNIKYYLVLFNKLKWLKIAVNKEKMYGNKKTNIERLLRKILNLKIFSNLKEANIIKRRGIIDNIIKKSKVQLEKVDLKAEIGIDNIIILSFLVALLDIIIGINLAKQANNIKEDKYKYVITPYQTNKFYLNISLRCIIGVRITNVIKSLFIKSLSISS